MNPDKLDEFRQWLTDEADNAERTMRHSGREYFSGRACAFRDAFEYLAILRMTNSVELPNASPSATPNPEECHE